MPSLIGSPRRMKWQSASQFGSTRLSSADSNNAHSISPVDFKVSRSTSALNVYDSYCLTAVDAGNGLQIARRYSGRQLIQVVQRTDNLVHHFYGAFSLALSFYVSFFFSFLSVNAISSDSLYYISFTRLCSAIVQRISDA